MMDGTPTHRLNTTICDWLVKGVIPTGQKSAQLPQIEELKFTVNSDVQKCIDQAIKNFKAVEDSLELRVQWYQGYGADQIKKFKCSPDAYLQMVLQLAYFKMYGVNRPTYESAATFKFKDGRTETCRSVSIESVEFCKAMEDIKATKEEKITKARAAINNHVKAINDATNGLGVDRHLFGLKMEIKEGEEVPAIYKDSTYSYSSSWYISSSQLSCENFNGYGWGPVIEDGYGTAYQILKDNLCVNITCRKQNPDKNVPLSASKLHYYIQEAADDMKALFMSESKL